MALGPNVSFSPQQPGGNASVNNLTIANTAQGANGTAAAPTYSFTASPDTGMYSPGTGQVALSSAGTQRLLINGTAITMAANLTVTGNIQATAGGTIVSSGGIITNGANTITTSTSLPGSTANTAGAIWIVTGATGTPGNRIFVGQGGSAWSPIGTV